MAPYTKPETSLKVRLALPLPVVSHLLMISFPRRAAARRGLRVRLASLPRLVLL